ncbi:XrtA/PEP-CTERM system TPR-repeat protein PrsT [Roseateles sp. BYS87W]|uniref:XrtA/PEP-CTERM system TPR-repeat protein PrsT n=1 Tax=Pelomonas baiyunensis TaxID=3299026 RepID=A0ABW7GXF6_9BURK
MTPRPALLSGLLAALLMSGTPVAQAQDAAKASRFYEDALQRYEKRDISGAIIQLKNALQADKTQLSVHVLLGKALLANSEPGAAEVAFAEAIRLGVDRAEVALGLAAALMAQGKQPQMLEDPRLAPNGLPVGIKQALLLERAVAQSDTGDAKTALATVAEARTLNPKDASSWVAEVPLRVRARQFPEAMAAADQALKLDAQNVEALYQKASVYHAMNDIAQALAQYDKAVKVQPQHAETRLARAGLLIDLGRDTDAAAELDELQKLKPNDPRGTYLRAVLAERAGNAVAMKAALKKITDLLDPVPVANIRFRPQFLMLNGLAHFTLGELEKAKPYLELAVKQQAGNPLNKLLAQIALAEPNVGRAADLLEGYVKARPGDGQALLMLASAYMGQGKHAKAAALMQDALKAADSPQYRTVLGLSLLQSGNAPTGADELARAYKADPRQTAAGLALVTVHLRNNQLDKALATADTLAKAQPSNPTVLMVQAFAKTQAKDYVGARAAYEQVAKLDPKLVDAQLGLARLDALAGRHAEADRRLRTLLRTEPRNVNLLFELALVNELWGKNDDALKWLEESAAASGPRDTRPNFALVAWLLRQGQPARAVEAAKTLLAKTPDDVEALQAYAAAQAANSDPAGARATLTNASRRAAFDTPKLIDVARQQILVSDLAGAAYSLDKALSGTPESLPAQGLLASVELSQGDPAKAEKRVRQIIQNAPKNPLGYTLLGDVALARGQGMAAVDAFKQAHDLEKSGASLLKWIKTLASQGQLKPALDAGDAWLKRSPGDAIVLSGLAEMNVRAKDFGAARRHYEALIKLQPNRADALNNLANVLIALKDPAAVATAERALKLDSRNATYLDTAGWAHLVQGNNVDRALQFLRDARLRAPNDGEIRYHLGAALARAQRPAEARVELEAALQSPRSLSSVDDAKKLLASLK